MDNTIKQFLSKSSFFDDLFRGYHFANKGYINDSIEYRNKQKMKIILFIFLNPRFAHNWFKFLQSDSFGRIFEQRPRLYIKPFRVYISTEWNKKKKLKVIMDTYRFIQKKESSLGPALTQPKGVIITTQVFNNTYELFLKLGYDDRFRKEGELVLSLECVQLGGKIISVAFSCEETTEGDWVFIIGCIQGHNNEHTQGAFKVIQKLLNGLRPNSFIIYALQELAKNLGISAILCVGDSIQAYRQKHAIHLPKVHDIHFDYNKFWQEVGGKNSQNGWFELPLQPTRKPIEEVESHKRSMYRKRYEMLDDVSLKICHYFNKHEISVSKAVEIF